MSFSSLRAFENNFSHTDLHFLNQVQCLYTVVIFSYEVQIKLACNTRIITDSSCVTHQEENVFIFE